MMTADGSYWITYNGEIYNYLELREELERTGVSFRSQSDTEVILEAYRAWGPQSVNRFVGMWSFVLVDVYKRKLFCSRDRFGIKPLYYLHSGGCLVVASEIKQILAFPFVRRAVHKQAAFEYLKHGATDHRAETMFDGVFQLEPGHNLEVDVATGRLSMGRYYDHRPVINLDITPNEAAREFRRLLTDSVRLHLRSDVEVGSCLSGGLDSSSIVCLVHDVLHRAGKQGLQRTFSSHFDEPEANEARYVREVVRATGVMANFAYPTAEQLLAELGQLIWHQDEPFGSTSIFAQWSVFKLVKEHGVKVMLDGQGADEPLAGYVGLGWYYIRELLRKRNYSRLCVEALSYLLRHRGDSLPILAAIPAMRPLLALQARLPSTPWIDADLAASAAHADTYVNNAAWNAYGEMEILNNALAQLTLRNNIPMLLRYEDRNSMAFSVEARVPFLDHRLVEFVMSLPSNLKIRAGYTKRVLRDSMAGILPEVVRWRVSKLGFATPERLWQQTILKPLVQRALASEKLRGYIDAAGAASYFEQLTRIRTKNFTPWRWVNFMLWQERYDIRG